MVGRNAAPAEPVDEDGNAEQLDERPQLLLPMPPIEAAAGHHDRPLGAAQQPCRLLDAVGRRRRLRPGRGGDGHLGLAEDDVEGVVDEGRAPGRGERKVQRRGRGLRDAAGLARGLGRLDQRRDEGKVIDLLQ